MVMGPDLLFLSEEALLAHDALTLANYDQLIRSDLFHPLAASVRPANLDCGPRLVAEPEVQPAVVERQVRRLREHRLGLFLIAVAHDHRRPDSAAVRLHAF